MTTQKVQQSSPSIPGFNLLGNLNGNIIRLLIAVVLIFVVMSVSTDTFLTANNFRSMGRQAAEVGLLSIAIALTMLTAGIDLSIVSTANLTGILVGMAMTALAESTGSVGLAIGLGLVLAVIVGAACGAVNGVLIGYFGMTPILATLGTLLVFRGIGTGITDGSTAFGLRESQFIGNGEVLGFPFPLLMMLVIAAILAWVLRYTDFGKRVYMLGTNATASKYSGIDNRRVLMQTYIISGVLAAFAGVIILGRTNAANVDFGASYILLSLLIAVLGDVDPYGGSGTIFGVLLSLFAVQMLSTGVNMLLFQSSGANFFKEFAWGAILVLVLVINHLSNQRKLKRAAKRAAQETEPSPST